MAVQNEAAKGSFLSEPVDLSSLTHVPGEPQMILDDAAHSGAVTLYCLTFFWGQQP